MNMLDREDVAENFHRGHDAEGSSRGTTQLLLEEGELEDAARDSIKISTSFLLDIARAVSVTDDVELGEVKGAEIDGRTNFVASHEVSANVIVSIGRINSEVVDAVERGLDGFDYLSQLDIILTIPGSVKRIKDSAFYCSQLEKAILEEGVEQIDQYAFNTYKKLYIYVPESVNSLAPKNGITNGEAVWTVVQGSYAEEYVKGKCSYEIDYTKPYSAYS